MNLFSRHQHDVGKVEWYTAKIELNQDTKNYSVKHSPIPRHLKPKVRHILRKFHENGIVGYCDALNPLVTNLLAVKKGVNDVRLVLDMRLCNYFTKRTRSNIHSLPAIIRSTDLSNK